MSSVGQKYVNWWARIKQGLELKQEIRPIIKTQVELTIKSVSTVDGSYCNPNRTNGKKWFTLATIFALLYSCKEEGQEIAAVKID